ncbi:ArsR/SmtB family transcription factor [Streptomyces sp. NPDC002523]
MEQDSTTVVTVNTAVELIARLYAGAHATKGDFEQVPADARAYVTVGDAAMQQHLQRYFGADFAVGMSLAMLAINRGWNSAQALTDGVGGLAPEDLVTELLASTTLEPADQKATRELVASALRDPAQRDTTARKVARRNSYMRKDVEYLLADPSRARAELEAVLTFGAAAFGEEAAVGGRLRDRIDAINGLLASAGRRRALLELTGGWTLKDETQRVVLVPTEALASLVITRLLPDGRMLVVFGPLRNRHEQRGTADLAAIAHALGSEQRLAILHHIAREPATGQTLAKTLGLTGATIHYHTSLLRSLGLVTSMRDVHSVVHSVDADQLLFALSSIAQTVLGDSTIRLESGYKQD